MEIKQSSQEQLLAFEEEMLTKDGQTTITIHGNCMWPVLRNGDKVTIRSSKIHDIKTGDVAIFKTSQASIHANICFNQKSIMAEERRGANSFFGKAVQVTRKSKMINLDTRPNLSRVTGMLFCPSNPYLLGLPKTLWQNFFSKRTRD